MANKAECSPPRGMQISVTIILFKEGMNHKLWTERLYLVSGSFHGVGGRPQRFEVGELQKPIKTHTAPFPASGGRRFPVSPFFFFGKNFRTTCWGCC